MVDSRLVQANERTLLAWVRTSIALMTFGFVIARIGLWLRGLGAGAAPAGAVEHQEAGTIWVGGAFLAMGVIANALAVARYLTSRRAILRGTEIPNDPFPVVMSLLVTAFGAIIGAYLLLRLR